MTSNFSELNLTNEVIEETKADAVRNRELVSSIVANGCIATVDERKLEDALTGGAEKATELPVLTENLVATIRGDSASSFIKQEQTFIFMISSSKLSTDGIASKLVPPAKSETPVQLRKNDSTTLNNNTALNSISQKNLTVTSLHMSVNFASCAGETKKVSSLGLEKIVNSRLIRTPAQASKENVLLQTSTEVSVDGIFKRRSVRPQPEKRRTITKHVNFRKQNNDWESAVLKFEYMGKRSKMLNCV